MYVQNLHVWVKEALHDNHINVTLQSLLVQSLGIINSSLLYLIFGHLLKWFFSIHILLNWTYSDKSDIFFAALDKNIFLDESVQSLGDQVCQELRVLLWVLGNLGQLFIGLIL